MQVRNPVTGQKIISDVCVLVKTPVSLHPSGTASKGRSRAIKQSCEQRQPDSRHTQAM